MSIESRPSFLGLAAPAAQQSGARMPLPPFIAATLLLPTMIVVGNFVLGVLTPTTSGPEDDLSLIDPVWRLVQGQHLGIDFHDPLGFGLFQVAAMLWRLLGPQYYVLRASADVFALVIILCSCVIAIRQLRHAVGLAALFCITVAFVASGPSIYGDTHNFGLAVLYNRLLMSGLLILFVQNFANDLDSRPERGYVDHFTTAFLLNTLFLVKISGLVAGLAIVVVGLILRGPFWRSLVAISLVLLILAVMVAIDFVITGSSLSPVIQEYRMAAQGRVGVIAVHDVLWFASRLPVLGVVVLITLYAVSRPDKEGNKKALRRSLCIIAFYWMCQVVLDMSNNGGPAALGFLAPAAAVAVVTWTDTAPDAASFWNRLWRRFHPRRLDKISARQVIPLLIIAMIFMPEVLASLRSVKLYYLISSGTAKVITVTAHKGITFKILDGSSANDLVPYLNRAIHAIESLGASRETIANLDFMNPFPALFLAPAPKGVRVWWDFSSTRNVPVGYRPSWREVIGNACIVTEPKHSPVPPASYSQPLIEAVEPHLAIAFTLVYQDELWKIWKHSGGCGATGGQVGSRLDKRDDDAAGDDRHL
jgi:hypothetical protein